jgi:hypothetical protein
MENMTSKYQYNPPSKKEGKASKTRSQDRSKKTRARK